MTYIQCWAVRQPQSQNTSEDVYSDMTGPHIASRHFLAASELKKKKQKGIF